MHNEAGTCTKILPKTENNNYDVWCVTSYSNLLPTPPAIRLGLVVLGGNAVFELERVRKTK